MQLRGPSSLILLAFFILPVSSFAEESRWGRSIQKFEARDKESPPPKHAVLFVGSSSIRGWDLERWFPRRRVINRGFGGSEVSDSIEFASRIIFPHAPSVVVLYAGDNDISKGKSPETVFRDWQTFVELVHGKLPETKILFVAIKPSLARWKLVGKMRQANRLIRDSMRGNPKLAFVDIDTPMIAPDGKPAKDLFVKDGLHLSAKGYAMWAELVEQELRIVDKDRRGRARVATCQFPVSGDVSKNAEWIRRQMREAYEAGSDVVHFPECALSGYAGVDHKTLDGFDWALQRREMESILALAKRLRLWTILGAAHQLSGRNKPHNSLYVISARGKVVDRYDKRFCTSGDLRHYSPGDHFVDFEIRGVRCGALICYDVRFPELFRQYHKRGAQLVFHSFYNARQREGSIHPKIMPPTAQARAATNHLFLSVNNSSAPRSWASLFVTPDGLIAARLETDKPGVTVNLVDTRKKYYDASRPYRRGSIDGKWNSGETVDDPRSKDRKSY